MVLTVLSKNRNREQFCQSSNRLKMLGHGLSLNSRFWSVGLFGNPSVDWFLHYSVSLFGNSSVRWCLY